MSKVIAEGVRKTADEAMSSDWWKNFPKKDDVDPKELGRDYFHMAHDMLVVAFAYILFEEPKYLECKERFLRS